MALINVGLRKINLAVVCRIDERKSLKTGGSVRRPRVIYGIHILSKNTSGSTGAESFISLCSPRASEPCQTAVHVCSAEVLVLEMGWQSLL